VAGSCAEAAKIGLRARESCANRLNYFHFRRCANHARDYGMQSAAALLPVGTSANGACRLDHACLGRLVGRKSSQAVQSSLDITEGRHPTSCG